MYNRSNNKFPISSITPYDPDRQQLQELELDITHKFSALASVVKDLSYIRESHLYPINLTFDQYVSTRWGFSAEVIDDLSETIQVGEDVKASNLGKLLTPFNVALVYDFLNLTKLERIALANRIDQELGFAELTPELVKRCKLELFPDKCETDDIKDTTNLTIRPVEKSI
jgi:hypothetical protein